MRQGEVSNYAESIALHNVIEPVIQRSAYSRVFPNHPISLRDGTTRYVDFALITDTSRIAVEVDGYAYHAEGAISRQAFDDQLHRQNELTLQGWTVARFSFDQIENEPEKCKDQLRRLIVSDPQLHRNFTQDALEPSGLQLEALAALYTARLDGQKRGLVALPTGTGKTILSALDAKLVGGRVLFIVHNNEILRQAAAAYKKVFPDASFGFINSEHPEKGFDEDLVFANIASLRSAATYKRFVPNHFNYVVLDEFHHGAAPSYVSVVKYLKPKFMLGLTATPERTDRKDILSLLDGNFTYSITTSAAIGRGFLVPFTYFGLHDNVDYSSIRYNGYRYDIADLERSLLIPSRDRAVVEKYVEHAKGKKGIGFCVSIKHAERMANVFCDAGIPSIAIHSNLPKAERDRRISLYERGKVECVFVRDLFNEGVDFPDTMSLMFLRPTESRVIFLQQLGRGLRLSPLKTNVVVLDFIGNYVGAAEIPRLLRAICSGNSSEEYRPKPQFSYDNGCKVLFSEKTIEHLALPDYKVVNKAGYVEKIVALNEKIGRPLTPVDIYIEMGDEFGLLIRSMGSYRNLADRMNKFDDENFVIDPEFSRFDASDALLEVDSANFLKDRAAQVFDLLAITIGTTKKGDKVRANRYRLGYADLIHENLTSLMRLLSPLCLIRNTVAAYAEGGEIPKIDAGEQDSRLDSDFLTFLAKTSSRRNSFAIANFLKAEVTGMAHLVAIANEQANALLLPALNKLMDRKALRWLSDFHDLTSNESLYK